MRLFRKFGSFVRRQQGFRKVLLHQLLLAFVLAFLSFLYAVVFNASMSYMGNKDDAAAAFVIKHFWDTILFTQLKILLVYFAGFSLLGALSAVWIRLFCFITERRPEGRWYRWTAVLLPSGIFVHWFGWSVLSWPAVYSRTLFEKGGIRRAVQVFLTDGPGAGYYTFVFTVCALFFAAVIGLSLYKLYRTNRFRPLEYFRARKRRMAFIAVPVAAAVLIPLIVSAASSVSVRDTGRKNLLILASDALRPDRLSLNGYARKTSPNLDRLFRKGVGFDRIFAEVPRTFPSWMTILCSQHSATHGIRHMFPRKKERQKRFPSLMARLAGKGYRTGVVSDFAGDVFPRVDLGFQEIRAPRFTFAELLTQGNIEIHTFLFPFLLNQAGRSLFPVLREFAQLPNASLLADEAVDMIRRFSRSGPFAVTVFFSTTHFPYANRNPWYKRYADPKYAGAYKYYKQQVVMQGQKGLTAADRRQVNALYDGGVAAADSASGRIIQYLRESGLLKNTVVVLVADHGENLYERGMGMGHGEHLRGDYATRIPFMIYDGGNPGVRYRRFSVLGGSVDIVPTLAALLGMSRDRRWEGRDLSPWMTGRGVRPKGGFAYSETGIWFSDKGDHFFQKQRIMYPDITKISEIDFKNGQEVVLRGGGYPGVIIASKHRCWREGRYKLIYIPTRKGIRFELYDTVRDPDNRKNLASIRPGVVRRLRKKLERFCARKGRDMLVNGFYLPGTQ